MDRNNLLIKAQSCRDGVWYEGYVCCCKECRTPFENEEVDNNRPVGLLTTDDGLYGNIRVYTDTMEFVNKPKIIQLIEDRQELRDKYKERAEYAMRDATPKEIQSVNLYIDKISKHVGNFDDLLD